MKKNLRELLRELPEGYTIGYGGKHAIILTPDGSPLRGPNGSKIVVSITPSDFRGQRNAMKQIQEALWAEADR